MPSVIAVSVSSGWTISSTGFEAVSTVFGDISPPTCSLLSLILSASSAVIPSEIRGVAGDNTTAFDFVFAALTSDSVMVSEIPPFSGRSLLTSEVRRPFGAIGSSDASSDPFNIGPFIGIGADGKPFFIPPAAAPSPKLFLAKGGKPIPFFIPASSPFPLSGSGGKVFFSMEKLGAFFMNGIPFPGSPACFSPIDIPIPPFSGSPFGAIGSSDALSDAFDIGPFIGIGAEGKPFFTPPPAAPSPKLFLAKGGKPIPFFIPASSPFPFNGSGGRVFFSIEKLGAAFVIGPFIGMGTAPFCGVGRGGNPFFATTSPRLVLARGGRVSFFFISESPFGAFSGSGDRVFLVVESNPKLGDFFKNGSPLPDCFGCFAPAEMPPLSGIPFDTSLIVFGILGIGPFSGIVFSGIFPTPPFFSALILIFSFILSDISNLAILARSASSAVIPDIIAVGVTFGLASVVSVTITGVTSKLAFSTSAVVSSSVNNLLFLIISASSAVMPAVMSFVAGGKSEAFDGAFDFSALLWASGDASVSSSDFVSSGSSSPSSDDPSVSSSDFALPTWPIFNPFIFSTVTPLFIGLKFLSALYSFDNLSDFRNERPPRLPCGFFFVAMSSFFGANFP